MTRALLEKAMDTLGNVAGNINPERGYADELEAEIKATFQAVRAELAKPEQQARKPEPEFQDRQMNDDHYKYLCETFPKLFKKGPFYSGFECGDGWFNLIKKLCEDYPKTR